LCIVHSTCCSVNGTPLLNNATLRSTTGSGRDFKYAALKLIAETAPPRTLRLLRPAVGAALTLSPADAALVFDEAFAVKPVAMPGGLVEGPTVPDAAAAAAVGSHVGQLFGTSLNLLLTASWFPRFVPSLI